MTTQIDHLRLYDECPRLEGSTLVLAFSGWMDGGDVSTGTVERLVDILEAVPFAEIDPEPFYIYSFPGSMEMAALFRPHIRIEDGLVDTVDMPHSTFYFDHDSRLLMLIGKEPHLRWQSFGDSLFKLAHQVGVSRILFVGSFGGSVPHTREPRLFVTVSDPDMLPEMEKYGVKPTSYEGPGSFTTYLMTKVPEHGFEMASLVAEIPGYLQGTNPMSIEAVTRRLAKILKLPLELDSLRSASTQWELEVSSAVEENDELATVVRQLEEDYDDGLLELESNDDP